MSLGFTVSPTVPNGGAFNCWLINTATGTWYGAGESPSVAGLGTYSRSFSTTGIPEGTYTAVVYYRPDASVWGNWQANASSPVGAATVLAPALSITMDTPTIGTTWIAGGTGSLSFTLSSAVTTGEFDAWIINTITGVWYPAGFSAPVALQIPYTQSFSLVGVPPGYYTAVVYYRPDATVWGNWQASATSPYGAANIP